MPNYLPMANEKAVEIMQGLKAGIPAPAGNLRRLFKYTPATSA